MSIPAFLYSTPVLFAPILVPIIVSMVTYAIGRHLAALYLTEIFPIFDQIAFIQCSYAERDQ